MSGRARPQTRARALRRLMLIAGGLVLLALLLLATGHWILAVLAGVPAVVALWVYFQARSVR